MTLVPRDQVETVIGSLYEAAQSKLELEDLRALAQAEVASQRESRKAMTSTRTSLANILVLLEEALRNHRVELKMIEDYSYEPKTGAFDSVAQFLRGSLEAADELSLAYTAAVHPELRDPRSERTAAGKFGEDYRIDPFFPEQYPARPQSPHIDHWFIGEAAACLDRCKTSSGEPIPAYAHIIRELFERIFGDKDRTEGSINQELAKQRKSGRPQYNLTLKIVGSQKR